MLPTQIVSGKIKMKKECKRVWYYWGETQCRSYLMNTTMMSHLLHY